jgi:hypothetical protein
MVLISHAGTALVDTITLRAVDPRVGQRLGSFPSIDPGLRSRYRATYGVTLTTPYARMPTCEEREPWATCRVGR